MIPPVQLCSTFIHNLLDDARANFSWDMFVYNQVPHLLFDGDLWIPELPSEPPSNHWYISSQQLASAAARVRKAWLTGQTRTCTHECTFCTVLPFFNIVCPLVSMNRGFVQGLRSGESLRPLGLVCACLRKRSLVRCPCAFPLQIRVKSPLQVPCIDILKMTYSSCWCESSGRTLLYEIHVSLFYASFCRILLSEVSSKKPCQILPIASHSVTICRDSLRCLGANILVKRSLYEGLADAMYWRSSHEHLANVYDISFGPLVSGLGRGLLVVLVDILGTCCQRSLHEHLEDAMHLQCVYNRL